jgi:multisubunit Na+/H+ antiporter MnhG subunit
MSTLVPPKLVFRGYQYFYSSFVVSGSVAIAAAVAGFLTRGYPPVSACGDPCPIIPPPAMIWTGPEIFLLVTGILVLAFGAIGLYRGRKTMRARDKSVAATRYLNSVPLGVSAAVAGAQATGFLLLVVFLGSTAAVPNGSGVPLICGALALYAVAVGIFLKGRRARSLPEGRAVRPSGM